jgi:hypothetical protein
MASFWRCGTKRGNTNSVAPVLTLYSLDGGVQTGQNMQVRVLLSAEFVRISTSIYRHISHEILRKCKILMSMAGIGVHLNINSEWHNMFRHDQYMHANFLAPVPSVLGSLEDFLEKDGNFSLDGIRVETKIFVFVFSRKFRENLFSPFAKKSLRKVTKITKTFAKTKMYEKTDAGNGKYCEIS